MHTSFEISEPHGPINGGDYLRFTAREGDKTWPMRISRSVLTTLAVQHGLSEEESFKANFSKIRDMSFEKTRIFPPGQEVTLSIYDI
ncbi:hypothetical protein DP57_2329 [Burkholderia pseudomallei]|nr:hypothetical protein DP57_2329 [Burkholderia pseudomallei]KGS05517.1 hypothetical protein X977_725 [Burkholderia pseudomallei MSHR7504]